MDQPSKYKPVRLPWEVWVGVERVAEAETSGNASKAIVTLIREALDARAGCTTTPRRAVPQSPVAVPQSPTAVPQRVEPAGKPEPAKPATKRITMPDPRDKLVYARWQREQRLN
jgi:hypothetical protein